MRSVVRMIWLVSLLAVVLQGALAWEKLPDPMPSKINSQGQVTHMGDKATFYLTWYGAVAFMNLMMPAVGFIIRKAPVSLINLPNKDYWLGNEQRRRDAAGIFAEIMCTFAVLLNIGLMLVFYSLVEAATTGIAPWPSWLPILVIVGGSVIVPIMLFRRYRIPHEAGVPR